MAFVADDPDSAIAIASIGIPLKATLLHVSHLHRRNRMLLAVINES